MKNFDNNQQAEQAMNLAIGRIFLLGSRPEQEGDIKQYEDARYVALCAAEYLGISVSEQAHSYQRDYHKINKD